METQTPQQQAAINKRGNFVLTAIPGSGKTFAVAKRIANIIDTEVLLPHQGVLALSFTNNAAKEIANTFLKTTKKPLKHPHYVGTIDSFLNNYIFVPFAHLVMGNHTRSPEILTSNEFLIEMYPAFQRVNYKPLDVSYNIDGSLTHNDTGFEASMKRMMYSNNLVSFNDVNYYSLKILENRNICELIIKRFPYIIIDEAQDCSDVQMAIIDRLCAFNHQNIALVGDPFQSIYEWRVAKPELFIEKCQAWEELHLSRSLRSGTNICNFLKRFHRVDGINLDSHYPDLISDIYIVSVESENNYPLVVKLFKQLCNTLGIEITKQSAAILCGSNRLASIFSGNRDRDSAYLWRSANNSVISLPLKAKILFTKQLYSDAFEILKRFFLFQKNNCFTSNSEHDLNSVKDRILIWKCLSSLPGLENDLDSWILEANDLIEDYCTKLNVTFNYRLDKKSRFRANEVPDGDLYNILILNNNELHTHTAEINVETIHKSKGKTYDAVLVPVMQRGKITVSKITQIFRDRELINTQSSEDKRCFYVACSRPRKLLFIMVPNDRALNIFEEYNRITSEMLIQLTSGD